MKMNPILLRKAALLILMAALPLLAFGDAKSKTKSKPKPKPKSKTVNKAKSYSLLKIVFSGLKQFDAEAAIQTSGLSKGQKLFFPDIDAAAQRLAESGFFASVGYQSVEKRAGLELEFQVEEAKDLLPCTFDNFVWFRNDELMKAVRDRLPLFKGSLPLMGNAKRELTAALQELLSAHQIPGKVRFQLSGDLDNAKIAESFIRVSDVSIPIVSVQFRGVNFVPESDLKSKTKGLMGQQYSLKSVCEVIDQFLIPLFKEKGFFRVQFREPAAEVKAVASSEYKVNLILDVIENTAYHWEKPLWTGDLPIPTETLNQIIGMNPGDVADQTRIEKGFSEIRRELSRQGYMDADIKTTLELNDVASSASYRVQLAAGAQYKMGSLTFSGAPDSIMKKLRAKWKIPAGEIFDGFYPAAFPDEIKDILESKRLIIAFFHSTPDRSRQVVDVTYQFRPQPRK
jgi:outer membrane protein insertion porin family